MAAESRQKPSRGRQWLVRLTKVLLGIYGGYFVLIHLLINVPLLPWLIQQPNSVTIHWNWALSPFPGWAYAKNFYLTVEDENIQMGLRIDQVSFWCNPLDLLHKVFHVTSVTGSGISFRMRGKRSPEEAAREPERMAALPIIAGFPDAIRRRPPPPPSPTPPNPAHIWTVHLEDVHAAAREFWVEGLRYDGAASAYGGFTIQPQIHANVDAHLDLLGGDLTYGAQRVGSELEGHTAFLLDDFSIIKEKGLGPLRYMHCQMALDGELQNARFLNPVLRRTPAPTLASSPGRFELFGKFEAGRIAPGSSFRLRASDWQLVKGVYRSSGNYAQLEALVDGAPPTTALSATVSLGSYEIDNPELEREIIEGEGLVLRLTSHRLDLLDRPLEDLGFEIDVDRARIPDLRIANDFFPPSKLWEVLSGSGELSGTFVSPPTGTGHGAFHLSASQVAVRFRTLRLAGNLSLDGQLSGVASNSKDVGLLGRDEMEGQGKLVGHIALSRIGDPEGSPLATFDATADLVLHPLLATEIRGADVLHHFSGELKVDGQVPGLSFLNGALEPHGVQLHGGAGVLTLDARLTHGILGRASELQFNSSAITFEGAGLHARADLAVAAQVGQLSDTPEVAVDARIKSLTAGPSELPALLNLRSIHLLAQSPELDVATLTAERPEATLTVDRAHIGDVSQLNRWLPGGIRLKRGVAQASLQAKLPRLGEGSGQLQLQVDDLAGNWKEVEGDGRLTLETAVTGLAEAPWKPDLLGRSHLSAKVHVQGGAHLLARTAAQGVATVTFRGGAALTNVRSFETQPLLRATDGQLALQGKVYGLAEVNRWLQRTPFRVRGGSAAVSADLIARAGQLSQGSQARMETRDLQLLMGPVCLDGPIEANAAIGPAGPARLALELTSPGLSVESRFLDQTFARGAQIALAVRTDALDFIHALAAATLDAQVTGMSLPHLEKLAALVPPLNGLVLGAGNAVADATVHREPSGSTTAHLALRAEHLAATLADQPVSGDLRLDAHLHGPGQAGSIFPPTLDLENTRVRIENATFPQDSDYWAEADVRQGTLSLANETLTMDVDIAAKDALPVLHLYGKKLGIPGILDGLLAFNHLSGSATLIVDPKELFVPRLDLHGDSIDFQGRIRHIEKHTFADFLLKLGIFSLGVDVRDDHTGVQLLGAKGWYEDRLRRELPTASAAP